MSVSATDSPNTSAPLDASALSEPTPPGASPVVATGTRLERAIAERTEPATWWSDEAPRLPWKFPTMLAPLEGVTHPEFRAIMAERDGLGILCTEFVRITKKPVFEDQLRDEVVKVPGTPLSVQVMGNVAERMAEAAGYVAAAGADVVDINMGCPVPKVVKKGVGAAMLKDPALLKRVLGSMRETVPGLLSAKIRAGFDDAAKVVHIAQCVQEAGADYIVVHPRRRADFFEGVSDWRIIGTLRRELDIPVIGNGDVWYAADALRMHAETGCDAVMLGRPALRNPWIFEQIAALLEGREPYRPTGQDLFEFMFNVRERYERRFADHRFGSIGKMKELTRYIGRTIDDKRVFMRSTLRLQTLDEMMFAFEKTLCPLEAEQLDLDAYGSLGLEKCGSAAIRDE